MIDTLAEVDELNEVLAVKRGLSKNEIPIVAPGQQVQANKKARLKGPPSAEVQAIIDAAMQEPGRRRTRPKPRVLSVPTKLLNIWKKLAQLDAGLSVLDWVAIDKDAGKNLIDGLKDLRKQRPRRSNSTGLTDDDLDLDDTKSVYSMYPYDLSKMKWSSPLKAEVSINGKRVVACFDDTGGSISIIIPWFQAYGVELDIARSIIKIPTTSGVIKFQGFTSHVPGFHSKEVYKIELAKKYSKSLEEDLIPDTGEAGVVFSESNVTEGVPEFLIQVVEEFKHALSEVSGLTKIKEYKMRIQLIEGAEPIRSKCFRLTWEDEDALINQYIDEMLELDLIEEADGTWSSAAFLVGKKYGAKRCMIDYRRLNKLTVQSYFPTSTVVS
ncbi:hypothetical protein [Parasitella parasitica]|uniref:Uncharacterized protein n=2 Tax=Parasitella parasitica TaxID=35722 RepID=A0A0B7NH77_9FUNG|nr:hypothetical protein [Parasitella parasitica]